MEQQLSMSNVFDHAGRVIKSYHVQLQPLCRELDLPPLALDILLFIANNPGNATATDICMMRGIKPGIVSVHIERLVRLGLLRRVAVDGDRRKTKLEVTSDASEPIRRGREIQRDFARRLCSGISDEDKRVWQRITETVDRNLDAMCSDK